ncbi:MAG: serine/threonine protein kinase, partial [Candidatus Obscuribacterales bacterium]|nr:serine/threonine protein kinase [Candidatus Obscuribacterales bacterium]
MNIIDQRFEVLEKLGEGGMGDVYKCTDNVLNKVVTVKILKQIGEGQNLFRFQQEAQALARLNHPNIVKVYDFKLTDTQNPILIMEYVKGIELKQLIEKNGPLTGKETETILLNIINGLDYAHKSGILHRDLKPANIIVTDTILLDLKIVDFGLAAMEEADHRLTATGVALGSPPYMSPEQISGSPTDQKTDIYSLGCLLFECLTGAPPFIGASALETMSMHINQPAPHLEDRPELEGSYFHEIISRCLEKAPEDRFSNLSEVEQLLKRQQLIDENKEVYNTQLDDKHNRLPLWWT